MPLLYVLLVVIKLNNNNVLNNLFFIKEFILPIGVTINSFSIVNPFSNPNFALPRNFNPTEIYHLERFNAISSQISSTPAGVLVTHY